MSRPNILFIMADQMSTRTPPDYRHKVMRTPAIGRLAREGMVLEPAHRWLLDQARKKERQQVPANRLLHLATQSLRGAAGILDLLS